MNETEKTQCVPAPSNTLQTREIAKLAKRRTGSFCVVAGLAPRGVNHIRSSVK